MLVLIRSVISVQQGGKTALMMAAEKGHLECSSILIASGADVNTATKVIT